MNRRKSADDPWGYYSRSAVCKSAHTKGYCKPVPAEPLCKHSSKLPQVGFEKDMPFQQVQPIRQKPEQQYIPLTALKIVPAVDGIGTRYYEYIQMPA